MRSPEDTHAALLELHGLFSDITRHLIQEYAAGDKSVRIERDRGGGAELIIFLFARAVQKQLKE